MYYKILDYKKADDDGETSVDPEDVSFLDVPLVISFEDRRFRVICREDCLSMLRREKKNAHYAFIFARKEEYEYYLKNFGRQFQNYKL